MKIGDEVYVHGFVDEIRKDTIIIRNDGGYFGTATNEVLEKQMQESSENCISRQAAIDVADAVWSVTGDKNVAKVWDQIKDLPSAQPEWNNHTVACLLAELFDDTCACNYNGIDEWLPEKCELLDSCPNPGGVACWEQFLKHKAERRTDGN